MYYKPEQMQRLCKSWGKGGFLLYFTAFLKFLEYKQCVLLCNIIPFVPQFEKTNSPFSHCFSRPRENTSSEFKIHVPEEVYMLLWSQVCYCLRAWLHALWLFVERVTFSSKDEDLLRAKGVDLQQLTQNRSSLSWHWKARNRRFRKEK